MVQHLSVPKRGHRYVWTSTGSRLLCGTYNCHSSPITGVYILFPMDPSYAIMPEPAQAWVTSQYTGEASRHRRNNSRYRGEISQQVVTRMRDLASEFSKNFWSDISGPSQREEATSPANLARPLAVCGAPRCRDPYLGPLNFSAVVAPLSTEHSI